MKLRPPAPLVAFLAKRFHAKALAEEAAPEATQAKALARIRREFAPTRLGQQQGLAGLTSLEALKAAPVLHAEELAELVEAVWQHNPPGLVAPEAQAYLMRTTGTSGQSKRMPYPAALARANKAFETAVAMAFVAESGFSRLLGGHFLITAGPSALERGPSGVKLGYGSGISTDLAPRWAGDLVRPSAEVRHLSLYAERLAATIAQAYPLDVRAMTGVPAWVPPQLEGFLARARAEGRPVAHMGELWENLRLYVWSGAPIGPYRDKLRGLFGPQVAFREAYAAGEAPLAYQCGEDEKGLRPFLSHTVLLLQDAEAPFDAPKLTLWEAELHRPYRLLPTTPGGLVNLRLGDVVAVTQKNPLRLRFLRRESEAIHLATEKAGLEQIQAAWQNACQAQGQALGPFAAEGVGPQQGRRPHYRLFVECPLEALHPLAQAFDEGMQRANHDYAGLRQAQALGPVELVGLAPGTLQAHLTATRAFGQGKPVALLGRPEEADALMALALGRSGT